MLSGGARVLEETGGYYVEPTVFDVSDPDARIAREEIFGPVLAVLTFDSVDEAVRLANDSDYGLAAAVWTATSRPRTTCRGGCAQAPSGSTATTKAAI